MPSVSSIWRSRSRARSTLCLNVASREVVRPVQLVEKVVRGRSVSRTQQQVRVGVAKATLLERLQRGHLLEQSRQRRPALPLCVDDSQLTYEVGG